jgi:hypothetical protein
MDTLNQTRPYKGTSWPKNAELNELFRRSRIYCPDGSVQITPTPNGWAVQAVTRAGGGPPVKVTGGGPGEYHTGSVYEYGFNAGATEAGVVLRFNGLAATETVPPGTKISTSNPITEKYLGASTTVYYVDIKVAL